MTNGVGPSKVHVLVELPRKAAAGGHVKSWERLANAAAGMKEALDLTVHFSGEKPGTQEVASNVRFETHKPIFSTAHLRFLAPVPEHADLARFHRGLARSLAGADVIHTTDAYFVFARTAERVARQRRVPLVTSIHTDTPKYTAAFTEATIERLFGHGRLARLLKEGVALPRIAESRMLRRFADHQQRCSAVVVSRPDQVEPFTRLLAPRRVSLLRRGIDRSLFRPGSPDREWLDKTFDVPPGRVVVAMVGRLDRIKNVMTVVEAVRLLAAEGVPMHLLCAGEGPDRQAIFERLGGLASCPGTVAPKDLARLYTSADLVAHASHVEEGASNAVLEALACGRPLLVASESGAGSYVVDGETGIVIDSNDAATWAGALRRVAADQELRGRLAGRAAAWADDNIPTWGDVLREDLVSVWRGALSENAAGLRSAGPAGG